MREKYVWCMHILYTLVERLVRLVTRARVRIACLSLEKLISAYSSARVAFVPHELHQLHQLHAKTLCLRYLFWAAKRHRILRTATQCLMDPTLPMSRRPKRTHNIHSVRHHAADATSVDLSHSHQCPPFNSHIGVAFMANPRHGRRTSTATFVD